MNQVLAKPQAKLALESFAARHNLVPEQFTLIDELANQMRKWRRTISEQLFRQSISEEEANSRWTKIISMCDAEHGCRVTDLALELNLFSRTWIG